MCNTKPHTPPPPVRLGVSIAKPRGRRVHEYRCSSSQLLFLWLDFLEETAMTCLRGENPAPQRNCSTESSPASRYSKWLSCYHERNKSAAAEHSCLQAFMDVGLWQLDLNSARRSETKMGPGPARKERPGPGPACHRASLVHASGGRLWWNSVFLFLTVTEAGRPSRCNFMRICLHLEDAKGWNMTGPMVFCSLSTKVALNTN